MRTAIRKHLRDFLAVVALIVMAALVGGYILTNQRLVLPAWVPVVGKDFYEVKAELSTAQAVTPGQGQTVNVAGVEVGEITRVELRNGRGVITLRIEEDYDARIFRDASVLLRPKSGLKDMTAELSPGSPEAGRLPEGGVIPVGNTLPDVNLDEILAALDADTRDYLQLLVGGAAEGLRGNGRELGAVLSRFEPVARGLRRVNEGLAERRANIRRSIHNLSVLMEELGARDDQVARFVETSNRVFASLADQDENLRATLRALPGALSATRAALEDTGRLATELGPTLSGLRPAARALGPSLRASRPFLRDTTPQIRDELRPFARGAQPAVRELRPGLRDLGRATPDLASSFRVVNALFDTLAYNPRGARDEGFLFYAGWASHLTNALFGTQDAHGPIRRGVVMVNCTSLQVLTSVAAVNESLGTLVGLLNAPRTEEVCTPGGTATPPVSAAPDAAATPDGTAGAPGAVPTPDQTPAPTAGSAR